MTPEEIEDRLTVIEIMLAMTLATLALKTPNPEREIEGLYYAVGDAIEGLGLSPIQAARLQGTKERVTAAAHHIRSIGAPPKEAP